MMTEKDETNEIDVHAKVSRQLREEFEATGLKVTVWLPKAMEDEIYLQNELRKLKRNAVHQMGSQGVSESPGQSHPDQKQTDTKKQ